MHGSSSHQVDSGHETWIDRFEALFTAYLSWKAPSSQTPLPNTLTFKVFPNITHASKVRESVANLSVFLHNPSSTGFQEVLPDGSPKLVQSVRKGVVYAVGSATKYRYLPVTWLLGPPVEAGAAVR